MSPKIFIVVSTMFLIGSCVFNCKDYLEENIKPLAIHGIVLKKQADQTGCFGSIVVRELNKEDTLDVCSCVVENERVWSYVLPDDSLYKEINSLKLLIIRGGKEKWFDYPCCAK